MVNIKDEEKRKTSGGKTGCGEQNDRIRKDRENKIIIFTAIILIAVAIVVFNMPPNSSAGSNGQSSNIVPGKGITGSQCCPLP